MASDGVGDGSAIVAAGGGGIVQTVRRKIAGVDLLRFEFLSATRPHGLFSKKIRILIISLIILGFRKPQIAFIKKLPMFVCFGRYHLSLFEFGPGAAGKNYSQGNGC